jgi:hypothetical protein
LNYNEKCAMGQFWGGCTLGASVLWVVDHGSCWNGIFAASRQSVL